MSPRWIPWLAVLLAGTFAVSAQATEVVVYYHTDALHSATTITNAQGQVIERTHYAPYGQVLNRALRDGPGYAGHQEDAATGLVYMQQRYYDPESGTFISADPVEANTGAGFNRYAYAADNPYRNVDPDGRQFSVPDCGANGCFPAGTKGSTGTMMGIVADANMASMASQQQARQGPSRGHKSNTRPVVSSGDDAGSNPIMLASNSSSDHTIRNEEIKNGGLAFAEAYKVLFEKGVLGTKGFALLGEIASQGATASDAAYNYSMTMGGFAGRTLSSGREDIANYINPEIGGRLGPTGIAYQGSWINWGRVDWRPFDPNRQGTVDQIWRNFLIGASLSSDKE